MLFLVVENGLLAECWIFLVFFLVWLIIVLIVFIG